MVQYSETQERSIVRTSEMEMETIIIQGVSVCGSLCILAAYVASQFKWLDTTSLPYILLNLIGSGILAVVAVLGQQWGFLLLEGAWAIISVWSLVKAFRGSEPELSH